MVSSFNWRKTLALLLLLIISNFLIISCDGNGSSNSDNNDDNGDNTECTDTDPNKCDARENSGIN